MFNRSSILIGILTFVCRWAPNARIVIHSLFNRKKISNKLKFCVIDDSATRVQKPINYISEKKKRISGDFPLGSLSVLKTKMD